MSDHKTSFDARIVLRPRTLDETFDLALAYLRSTARDYRKLTFVFIIASLAPIVLLFALTDLTLGPLAAITVLTTGFAERTITVFAGRHLFQNQSTVGGAYRAVFRRMPFVLFGLVIVTAPVLMLFGADFEDSAWTGGGVMLAFFWPFLIASHAHVAEVAHLEQLSAGKAMQRARALVAYRFGRGLALVLSGAVIRGLFVVGTYSAATFLFGFMLQFQGVSDSLGEVFGLLGYVLAGPYMAMVRFFDYIDARTRREGWDIQVRFNAIAQKERSDKERSLAA